MTQKPEAKPVLRNDCFAPGADLLTHDGALALIDQNLTPLTGHQMVPLERAGGHYLARDYAASAPVPACDNSAMDGYAVRVGDLNTESETIMKVGARIAAGDTTANSHQAGTATRIFTGAWLPSGADAVVMQEDVLRRDDGTIAIPAGVKIGANIRRAGEDLAPGDLIAGARARLRPQDLAALASVGTGQVSVFAPLKVGLLSTGDEIFRPGQGLGLADGQVYDANYFLLNALLGVLPVRITDLGICPDTPEAVRDTLSQAAKTHDVIITSGGASMGEEDYLVTILGELGTVHGWKMAIKPGRPLGFGVILDPGKNRQTVVMTLPGNPVAVMVCLLLYGFPMLARLGGGQIREPARTLVPAAFEMLHKKPGRREFLRGAPTVWRDSPAIGKYPSDGSGLISSLRSATGLIEIPEPVTRVRPGDMVAFIPFTAFGLPE
ncbi:MAG: molybdopterin molybdotransferase MoeA [Alphaproteobacteria bacterium]